MASVFVVVGCLKAKAKTMKKRKISLFFLRPIPKNTDLKKCKFRFYEGIRTKKIMLRFTNYEYEQITKDLQMPLAKYCREVALDKIIVRRIHPPKVNHELLRQLAMIGNNLNQLTRMAHQKNNSDSLELLAVANELLLIRQSIDDIKNHYTAGSDNVS